MTRRAELDWSLQTRQHWMDALRGAAVLLVALWHAFEIPDVAMPTGVEWVFNFLAVYRVPMLMFLSGLLLDHSLRKPTTVYVGGKLRRIAWPLVVWSAILLLVGWPADAANPWFWVGDGAHLWYLGVLLACYAIGLLTRWVPPILIFGAGFLAMELVRTEIAFVNNMLWFGLYFFAGAALSRWLGPWLRTRWFMAAGLLVIASAWAAYSATVNGYVPIAHWRPLVLSLLGVLGVVWFAARLPRLRWVEWVGERSIVFYVAHVPLIVLAARLTVGVVPSPLVFAFVIAVMLCGCILLGRFLNGSALFVFPVVRVGRPRAPLSDERVPAGDR
ncbi:acyltransferase family protein [Agromyces sp. ZXT2-3]|uniref:acyltransferase family protein n=1 Tax=Agromyces sp. ZXT2-3 TaxID=3461152 RepID=UPI004054D4EC